ncbi:hypothetical protein [Subtercola lobariae]|uniref:Uncharacterized protein n=1 Tax=Subtercola lobariae TaxID=1588641 RepID=A0A917EX95_9MICO|nr:hypothetical protein [Subtercola lobariae]GGF18536.1 hypothetical protein GCM10011399_10230 [Subtercola lobariae]
MSQEITTLFGGTTTGSGQRISNGVARQTKREAESIAARTELAQLTDNARAFLTSSALTNVGTLVSQAEQMLQIAPSGARYYELIINAYGVGAANAIARFS